MCIYVYIRVYMCIYVYIYICIYIMHNYNFRSKRDIVYTSC